MNNDGVNIRVIDPMFERRGVGEAAIEKKFSVYFLRANDRSNRTGGDDVGSHLSLVNDLATHASEIGHPDG